MFSIGGKPRRNGSVVAFVDPWAAIASLSLERDAIVEIDKTLIVHPGVVGAVRSHGWPRGQLADWRFPPDSDCRGLHVHEFELVYRAHVDEVHPECSLVEHIRRDVAPLWLVTGTTAGAIVGALANRPGTGAALGLTLAMISLPRSRRR